MKAVVIHSYSPSTEEVEAGELEVQGQPQLHSSLSLGEGAGVCV